MAARFPRWRVLPIAGVAVVAVVTAIVGVRGLWPGAAGRGDAGSHQFKNDLLTGHEVGGIPGGETPPSTAGGTPAATDGRFMGSGGRGGGPEAKGASIVFEGVALHSGRARDEIQPIDHPVFAPSPPNSAALGEDDWVVGVNWDGLARAYPLWVLGLREMVNDRFGTEPICVTYCTLSASAVAFRSRIRDRDVSFGNDGALYECNLVMYDRGTGSLWYQLRGLAIHGPLAGERLSMVPAEVVQWGEWRRRFPEGQVLVGDKQTGRFFRLAGGDSGHPGGAPSAPEAPVSRMDARLPVMERVVGLWAGERSVCFTGQFLADLPDGRHAVPGVPGAWLEKGKEGGLRGVDGVGVELPLIPAYWFAWHAAYPTGGVISSRVNP